MGGFFLLVELHQEGSAPAACAATLFFFISELLSSSQDGQSQGITQARRSHHITGTSSRQRCKNVRTCEQCLCKKNPISGKIFAKFYAVLSRKLVMSQFCAFWWHFMHILKLFVTFWHFFALTGSLGPFTLFSCKLDLS